MSQNNTTKLLRNYKGANKNMGLEQSEYHKYLIEQFSYTLSMFYNLNPINLVIYTHCSVTSK